MLSVLSNLLTGLRPFVKVSRGCAATQVKSSGLPFDCFTRVHLYSSGCYIRVFARISLFSTIPASSPVS